MSLHLIGDFADGMPTLAPILSGVRSAEGAHGGGHLEHPRPRAGAQVYTVDSRWRNRAEFFQGRDEIIEFVQRRRTRELDYRLIKELWALHENRIAVRF
jgi:hypothetical protein